MFSGTFNNSKIFNEVDKNALASFYVENLKELHSRIKEF